MNNLKILKAKRGRKEMGATKVGYVKIVFNNGRVMTYNNVMVVIKENCIVIEKNKNNIGIIPYDNVMEICLLENE